MSKPISLVKRQRILNLFLQNPASCLQSLADTEKVTYYAVYKTLNESEIDWKQLKKDSIANNRLDQRLQAEQQKQNPPIISKSINQVQSSQVQFEKISKDQSYYSDDQYIELEQIKGKSDTNMILTKKKVRNYGFEEQYNRNLPDKTLLQVTKHQPQYKLQSEDQEMSKQVYQNQYSNPEPKNIAQISLKQSAKNNKVIMKSAEIIFSNQSVSYNNSEQVSSNDSNQFRQRNQDVQDVQNLNVQQQQQQQHTEDNKFLTNERKQKLLNQVENLFVRQEMIKNEIQQLEINLGNKIGYEQFQLDKNRCNKIMYDNSLTEDLRSKIQQIVRQELENHKVIQVQQHFKKQQANFNQQSENHGQADRIQSENTSNTQIQNHQNTIDTSVKEALTVMQSLKVSNLRINLEGGEFMVSGEQIINAILKGDTVAEFGNNTLLQVQLNDHRQEVKIEEEFLS